MKDIHQEITNRIVEKLEQGVKPWQCPWRGIKGGAFPVNYSTGDRYNGINVLLLWLTTIEKQYSSNAWLTFKQAKALGGCVRKGEKATLGVFYKPLERTVHPGDENYPKDGSGGPEKITIPMAKPFWVFNLDQIDGIEPETDTAMLEEFEANEAAERLLAASGARILEGLHGAAYSPTLDEIRMPYRRSFRTEANFYATACHELTHWTGHPDRLARDFKGRFGDSSYAFEELVAELGSAFLSAELGLTGIIEEHASYLDAWLSVLKEDKRAVFKAASLAAKAHTYLMDLAAQE